MPESLIAGLLSLILFIAPITPDIKLTRPKLLVLEMGLYSTLFLILASQVYYNSFKYRKSPILLPLAAYLVAQIVFYAISPDKPVALNELRRTLLSVCAFLAATHALSTERFRHWALGAFIAGGCCAAVYGILQRHGGIGAIAVPQMDRVMSTFGNPIFFAAHLIIVIPVAAGIAITTQRSSIRTGMIAVISAALLALYYSQTRAAFIACAAGFGILAWLTIPAKRTRWQALGFMVCAFGVFAFLTKHIWFRQQAHFLIWRDTLAMWTHYPWLGTGPGTFHIYFPTFASNALHAIWPQKECIVNDAHNEYVQYLAETGIVGFGIYAWLIVTCLRSAFTAYATAAANIRPLIGGLAAAAVALLLQNVFSVDMRFIVSSTYLFMLFGIIESFNASLTPVQAPPAARTALALGTLGIAAWGFPDILRPYIAQRHVAAAPDFFDERVLAPAKTIDDLIALTRQYPTQSLVFERLAWVYAKERNFPKAIEAYETAHRLNPSAPGPLNNIGNIYFLENNRAQAISYWERSLQAEPRQIDSRLNLATAYYYNGQLKQCADQLKAVLAIEPNNEKAIVFLKRLTE